MVEGTGSFDSSVSAQCLQQNSMVISPFVGMYLSGAGQARLKDIADARHDWDAWRLVDHYKLLRDVHQTALHGILASLYMLQYGCHVNIAADSRVQGNVAH